MEKGTESDIIQFPRKKSLSEGIFRPLPRVHLIGLQLWGLSQIPPMVQLFELLSAFDEAPLPDGNVYQLRDRELRIRKDGEWRRSEATINDLAALVMGLTHAQWIDIKQRSWKDNRINLFDLDGDAMKRYRLFEDQVHSGKAARRVGRRRTEGPEANG